jgi:hypothetical protein
MTDDLAPDDTDRSSIYGRASGYVSCRPASPGPWNASDCEPV